MELVCYQRGLPRLVSSSFKKILKESEAALENEIFETN